MKAFGLCVAGATNDVNTMTAENAQLKELLDEYAELFKDELGHYKYDKINLKVKPEAQPIFIKPRPVAFALKEQVDSELTKLERDGVITRVEDSEWGTPLVPVVRPDGKFRLCVDYKTTVNKVIEDVKYPIPRIEEVYAALQGGKRFTKLDFSQAYNQLELTENTKKLLAWSTHKGIFIPNRLPYGTKPASAIFQQKVEKLLQGLKGVKNFMDDIAVTGKTTEEHLANLREVFERLRRAGLRLKLSKCKFFETEIVYIGHIISENGLRKDPEKVKAMLAAPTPQDAAQVKAFVGMANYYARFSPNLATKLAPLYAISGSASKFEWNKECDEAFSEVKKLIASDRVLAHYDPALKLMLTCDASSVGVGAVLLQVYPDDTTRPISFASQKLKKEQLNSSVIQKEAFAIFWAVNKFNQYLWGNEFILLTDHKPLVALFGENKGIPQMAAGRLQRWALFLSGFKYVIRYVKGKDNAGANGLSRLPIESSTTENTKEELDYFHFLAKDAIPLDADQIRSATRTDATLSKIAVPCP